ncbi:uncharacterized protein LOC132047529 [Lycium ferocissimum]|uniref:uncharacterized protein LOC132047529 n=1 Tax=Lycium ferocissimum TaxID=112874 RepID=UPI002815BE44|nr:uncharacterized protein LOC132047529 [Lycium ferocissimum]
MRLNYIPSQVINGQPVVQLAKDAYEKEVEKWKCAMIAYFIGDTPGYNMMRHYMNQNWSTAANPDLYLHDDGYYVIKFQSIEDMHEIFYSGPYTINNRPIILKPWTSDFDFTKEYPTEIPLWVTFPKLPMSCWDIENLSRIASAIGVPVYADECTTKQTRISYARMLIEVNVTQPLPEKIMVMDPVGKQFLQEIDYDWRPKYCEICQQVGHKCTAPPKQIRETGKQKEQHKKGV